MNLMFLEGDNLNLYCSVLALNAFHDRLYVLIMQGFSTVFRLSTEKYPESLIITFSDFI